MPYPDPAANRLSKAPSSRARRDSRRESSLLASLSSLLGALPHAAAPINRQELANLSRGELLCKAFEVYRERVTDPRIIEPMVVMSRAAITALPAVSEQRR